MSEPPPLPHAAPMPVEEIATCDGQSFTPRGLAILTGLFFVGLLIQISRHIMWRDELRTWQICMDATGLISLWELMRFDAVPFVWNWIVFFLTRFTSNPLSMQVTHAIIASAVVYVVARCAPFSRLAKALFAFGYYPFFEYGLLARNYAPLNLMIFIACAMVSRPRVNLVGLAILCFFMCQVSIWGIGFSGLFFAVAFYNITKLNPDPQFNWNRATLAQGIFLFGVGVCLVQLFPGPGLSFRGQWLDEGMTPLKRIFISLSTYYRALVPIPLVSPRWWNSNILDYWATPTGVVTAAYVLQALLSIVLLTGTMILLLRRPVALFFFAAGAMGLLLFTYASFMGYNRHHGYLFILLFASMWLSKTVSPPGKWGWDWAEANRERIFTWLLALNTAIAVPVVIAALIMPFSATWAVAQYIKANHYDQTAALVAMSDYAASPITQWLHQPIAYLQTGKFQTYNTQDDAVRSPPLTDIRQTMSMIHDACVEAKKSDALVMFNCGLSIKSEENGGDFSFFHIDTNKEIHGHLTLLPDPEFNNSIVDDEVQRLYLFHFHD